MPVSPALCALCLCASCLLLAALQTVEQTHTTQPMYTPPILYATQDDINARRKTRNAFRDQERNKLLHSINTVEKRDKREQALKSTNKDKEKKKKKDKKKNKKKKKNGSAALDFDNDANDEEDDMMLDKNSSFRDVQSVVDLAATAGPVQVVRLMRANPTNFKLLTIACGALGDMASFSRRDQIGQQKGMFTSRNAHDYHSTTSHVCLAISQADGIKAILDVVVKHRAKEGLVLRGLWALEHILEVHENWLKFNRQGGPQRLELIDEVVKSNPNPYTKTTEKKIALALKKLQKQPVQGDDVRSQYCTLL